MERIYAFIDESGSFGWDLENPDVSTHFIIVAILVQGSDLASVRTALESIRKRHFQTGEIKSSHIKRDQHDRRQRILAEMLYLPFTIFAVVIDKNELSDVEGLHYKGSFYKFTNNIVHKELQHLFSRLTIVADEIGGSDYMKSFCEYVKKRLPIPDLFGESEFLFQNSKNDVLIQLADLIAGSLAFDYDLHKKADGAPVYHKMLRNRIARIELYPKNFSNYTVDNSALAAGYDSEIAGICLKKAFEFLERHESEIDEEIKAQGIILKYLLFVFQNIDPRRYIPTWELKEQLKYTELNDISTQTFRTRIIARLRDNDVIISGSSARKGYKIPANIPELLDFLNHGTTIVMPMLARLRKCRDIIKLGTLNQVDLFGRPEYAKLKSFFDEQEA